VGRAGFQLYGYEDIEPYDEESPMRLREVTIVVDSKEAKALGEFIIQCAEGIAKHGILWEHEHFKMNGSADIIIFNSSQTKAGQNPIQ